MNKLKNRIGMTLAEVLIVVGIIAVLGGVASVAVWNYQRSLGQLERDGIAKEIFVAAQNHLTAAFGEGYLGLSVSDFGTEDTASTTIGDYYYVVNGGASGTGVFEQMLPFGSIDETVRTGGSYIIRYQKDTGTVLDVFYCSRNGSPTQFNHDLTAEDYSTVLGLRDTDTVNHKPDRRNWDSHILGWYGGTEAATLATLILDLPTIEVVNGDKLYVVVTDPNSAKRVDGAMLQLVVEGMSSGAKKAISLSGIDAGRVTYDLANTKYIVVLDDITKSGFHFAELGADSGTFIPGENIKIQAVAYSTSALANISYSAINRTNSLFGSISDTNSDNTIETANIYSIRHLENLDAAVSNLGSVESGTSADLEKFKIGSAVQTDDLNWSTFTGDSSSVTIYGYESTGSVPLTTAQGNFYPIQPNYDLTYDGRSHSISKIQANGVNAGLFGSVSKVSAINNLELIDFSITGTTSAGALAGSLTNCTVTNVLARNSAGASTNSITAPTAGGLIGSLAISENGTSSVNYSAASVIVGGNSTTTAGGLIGNASGKIIGCYSGGHTKNGSYEEWVEAPIDPDKAENGKHSYDVTGGTAGGLVGISSATISNSYSTCSVSGTTAGGFAGVASNTISNCYATGLINTSVVTDPDAPRTPNSSKGAFVGQLNEALATGANCKYYSIINEVKKSEEKNGTPVETFDHYLGAVGDAESTQGITPLDFNVKSYNDFVGGGDTWNSARAFDASLVKYYSGKYPLRTVQQLPIPADGSKSRTSGYFVSTHYGDWPSPEMFIINSPST